MSNCNNLFHDFNKYLKITKTKTINLMKSKDNIRKKIKEWFKENQSEYTPKFYIQGSRKLGTLIRTKNDTCDLDDGVYFEREIGVTGTTLQKWICEAVKDITDAEVIHKAKCIRVIYSGDYHIDIPVYYFPEDSEHPLLAVKDSELEESDPKDFVEWFLEQKCDQLVRIIKYLKAWGDHLRNKMPSGLAFTVLAEKNYVPDDRDDISFYKTLKAIKADLEISFECVMPTTPFDDLFSDYDQDRINRFFERLDNLIDDARLAIEEEENQLKASKIWKNHLGKRFPEGLDENVDEKLEELLKAASLIASGKAGVDKHGHIKCKEPNDVPVKKHRFYGE
ncbi:MAG TPA: hypothetical protein DCL80_02975 [Balneola sp.]|nr:hypothetical protein [Balneola sp.]MAO78711.1 hypothetical protein [Balneola sp.]MBF64774.1 hypothetical protein [Balneola sp.]HAH50261.1 hypothetical protein [Balneola sp.]HAW80221.1 hypothetical protein [Balneola sp.]|tara:strand:- start:6463 stop:7470 length:1008 start_codon:yes stop_codon:yes gene_type:complete